MIFQQVWNRFTKDWKSFGAMGIGPFLIMLATMVAVVILAVITLGPGLIGLIQSASHLGGGPRTEDWLPLIGSAILFFVLVMLVAGLAGGLMYGGLMGSVLAYRRGEAYGLGAFWGYASRYFGRFFGLTVITGLIGIVLSIVTFPVLLIPGIGGMAVSVAQSILMVNLALYPGYLIVAEEMPVTDALRTGFLALTRNFGEACLGGLIMMAFTWCFALTALVNIIPLLGQVVWIGLVILFGPFVLYYFCERFETNVRPILGGPGQGPA